MANLSGVLRCLRCTKNSVNILLAIVVSSFIEKNKNQTKISYFSLIFNLYFQNDFFDRLKFAGCVPLSFGKGLGDRSGMLKKIEK